MQEEEGMQRRYRNGKVVYAKWNPTCRRFNLEQGTTKLINKTDDKKKKLRVISTTNTFTMLQKDVPDDDPTMDKESVDQNTKS